MKYFATLLILCSTSVLAQVPGITPPAQLPPPIQLPLPLPIGPCGQVFCPPPPPPPNPCGPWNGFCGPPPPPVNPCGPNGDWCKIPVPPRPAPAPPR